MNYIKLINAFWQLRRKRADFDPYVITLYFALVSKANKEDWKSFQIYREDIVLLAGMGPTAYYKARKILKDAGAIEYKEGASKLSQCSFSIIQLYAASTVADTEGDTVADTEESMEGDTVGTTVADTEGDTILNKPINPKTYKPLNLKTKSLHQSAIAAFMKFYVERFKTEYAFSGGKDAKSIKSLLAKIQQKTVEAGREISDENVLAGFTHYLDSITDVWVLDKLSIALLDSQFNQLFKSAKNGTQNSTKQAGAGFNRALFRDMVASTSSNPERRRAAGYPGQDAACQDANGAYDGESPWRYPGEQVKAAG